LTLKEIGNVVTGVLSRVAKHAVVLHQLFTEPNEFNGKQTFVLKIMTWV
jgi:hypothetical protein